MTVDEFRSLALSFPEAVESAHQDHPDFRVRGKIFATLGPDGAWGMVKLPPEDQAVFVRTQPEVFEPFAGAWGRQGCTRVTLVKADEASVRQALAAAWGQVAPNRMALQSAREQDGPVGRVK